MTDSTWTRRDFFKRSAGATAAVVGGPVLLGACSKVETGGGGELLKTLKSEGSVMIGIADEAPYGYKTPGGKVTGEAPEVARAVFKNMGIGDMQAEVTAEFSGLIPGLRQDEYDIVCAGMAILPDRCANADFSIPDYCTPTALLVPKGNPKNVMNFQDVAKAGVKVGVWTGTIEQQAAESAGIAGSNIVTFPDAVSMYEGVIADRVYCAALTDISLKHLVETKGGDLEVTDGFDAVIDGKKVNQCGGFVFRPNNDPFRKAFNKELRKLHESGKWLEIAKPFGFTEANVPAEGVTTEELCKG